MTFTEARCFNIHVPFWFIWMINNDDTLIITSQYERWVCKISLVMKAGSYRTSKSDMKSWRQSTGVCNKYTWYKELVTTYNNKTKHRETEEGQSRCIHGKRKLFCLLYDKLQTKWNDQQLHTLPTNIHMETNRIQL